MGKYRHGLALIEVLVVLAIIGVIVAAIFARVAADEPRRSKPVHRRAAIPCTGPSLEADRVRLTCGKNRWVCSFSSTGKSVVSSCTKQLKAEKEN